jgi:hypothetical protein
MVAMETVWVKASESVPGLGEIRLQAKFESETLACL